MIGKKDSDWGLDRLFATLTFWAAPRVCASRSTD